jgi:SHS family lactate transporter-like MFS transporter
MLNGASSNQRPQRPNSQTGRGYAITAGLLGWTLDSFDFFVVVFIVDNLATHFVVGKTAIILTIGVILATRPLGALLFGMLADRYGRRIPLMSVVAFFSLIELLSGLASNYPIFLVLRALYGIGMGGFWGVGAAMTLESAPPRWRGLLSGVLQGGYPLGYLLAALAARVILPSWGWRPMFWAGLLPATITMILVYKSPESVVWKQHRVSSSGAILQLVWKHRASFAYPVLAMTLMTFLSHGTQDLYPDFLKSARNIAPNLVAYLAVIYNGGAILGTISVGHISERLGRRGAIVGALTLCLLVIPLWAFGRSFKGLAIGAFLIQLGVQGAWGVIPAYLNEISPDALRSLFPGLVYQLGVLFGSGTNTIEYALRDRLGYEWALAIFEGFTIVVLMIVFAKGPESKGKSFLKEPVSTAAL